MKVTFDQEYIMRLCLKEAMQLQEMSGFLPNTSMLRGELDKSYPVTIIIEPQGNGVGKVSAAVERLP